MPGLGTDPSGIQLLLSGRSTSVPGAAVGDGTATASCTNCRGEVVLVIELAAGLVQVTVLLLLFGCAW